MPALIAFLTRILSNPVTRWLFFRLLRPLIAEAAQWCQMKYAQIKGRFAAKKFKDQIKEDNTRDERRKDESDFLNS